ncbi:MAG: cellulose biosynthesis cyclic di-GMP-binding regulatory protein BcsB [Thermodesulfobacteriota bacterium]
MKRTRHLKLQRCRLLFMKVFFFCALILPGVQAHGLEQVLIPLTKFNSPGIVKLGNKSDSYTLKVPVPERWQIEEAALQLVYVNSTALLETRSRLVVLFNDYPLSQVSLEPGAPEGHIRVNIPARLFAVGYNNLQIQVAQDFKDEGCIPENAAEVWTSLKLIDSSLALSYSPKEVPLHLSSVADFLFDPKKSGKNQVHIVTEGVGPEDVNLAAIAAAAVALRFDYRPVQFSSGSELRQGRDNILIGSRSFLHKIAGDTTLADDIGILPLPGEEEVVDRHHALLYLSGGNGEEIRKSVNGFSILSLPLIAAQSSKVSDVELPPLTHYSGKNRLAPGKRYSLQELGYHLTTFRGMNSAPAEIAITLPTYLHLEENRDILIRLDLSYGAAMRNDSVLALNVNGKFIASVQLHHPEGGQYRGYTLRLPLSYLEPGRNVLEFKPLLFPLHTGKCEMTQTENLALTLFESSSIELPNLMHWVKLPQLSYLFNDGYPLTAQLDFGESVLMLPGGDRASLAAALNVIAGISQKTGVLPYRLSVAGDAFKGEDKNILAVGPRGDLPEAIVNASPLSKTISLPINGRLPGTLHETSWQERFTQWIFGEMEDTDPIVPDIAILGTDIKIPARHAALCAFESPFSPGQSVIVFTAESGDDLLQASILLQESEVSHQSRDSFTLIAFQGQKPVVQAAALSPSYSVGEMTLRNRISYLVEKYRWPFIGTLVGSLLLFVLLISLWLKNHRRKRLRLSSGEQEE